MLRLVHVSLIGTMFVAAVGVAAEAEMYKGYETPEYRVVARDGDFEEREYQSHLVAEVTVAGPRGDAISAGFRKLAGFIFGGNVLDAKVAMTSPVSQIGVSGGGDTPDSWIVRFMMPSEYTRETLPRPNSPEIRIVDAEPERQVVLQFSGRWTEAQLAQRTEQLREYALARGHDVESEPRYYFYDGPMTLPWNRRNEVAFAVN